MTCSTEGSDQKETYITYCTGFYYGTTCTARIAHVSVEEKRSMTYSTEGSLWQEIYVNVLYRALYET